MTYAIFPGNDYGESSYLNSPAASVGQIYPGAEAYVEGFDHTAFQFVLPYFISAYKAGNTDVPIPTEGAVAWYRTTPKAACSDGGKHNHIPSHHRRTQTITRQHDCTNLNS